MAEYYSIKENEFNFTEETRQKSVEFVQAALNAKKLKKKKKLFAALAGVLSMFALAIIGAGALVLLAAAEIAIHIIFKKKIPTPDDLLDLKEKAYESAFSQFVDNPQIVFNLSEKELEKFKAETPISTGGDIERLENRFEGKYRNIEFSMVDYQGYKVKTKEHSYKVKYSINHCHLIEAEFPKAINGEIVIRSVKDPTYFEKAFELQEIKMDNPEFAKKFTVYATDAQIAYFLLTPQLMEKLLRVNDEFPASFYFNGNKIAIATMLHGVSYEAREASDIFATPPMSTLLPQQKEFNDIGRSILMDLDICADMFGLDLDIYKTV